MKLSDKIQLWKMFQEQGVLNKGRIVSFMRKHCHELSDGFTEKHVGLILPILERHLLEEYQNLEVDRLRTYVMYLTQQSPSSKDKNTLIKSLIKNINRCKNLETIYGDPITDIPGKLFHVTPFRRCHNVNDLVQYLLTTPKNRDPSDPYLKQPIYMRRDDKLFSHPGISKTSKKRLQQMENDVKGATLPSNIYSKYIELIGKLGYILSNDDPFKWESEFHVSQQALINFRVELDKLDDAQQEEVLGLSYERKGDETVRNLLDSFQKKTTCLHLIGNRLIRVYLHHFKILENLPVVASKKMKRQQYQKYQVLHPLFKRIKENPDTIVTNIFGNTNENYTNFSDLSDLRPMIFEYDPLQASYILQETGHQLGQSTEYINRIRALLDELAPDAVGAYKRKKK